MQYYNFVQDFPSRCGELLEKFENKTRIIGREVTLMICIATAGFTVPYERMRKNHSAGDGSRYDKARKQLTDLYNMKFYASALGEDSSHSWHFGNLKDHAGGPDNWPEMDQLEPLAQDISTRDILYHLRNALAHGNIFTMGKRNITRLVFLSETDYKSGDFNYLTVIPSDFSIFLKKWFQFIESIEIPNEVVRGAINDEDYRVVANY